MQSKKHIFLFILIIAVFQLAFQYMNLSLRGDSPQNQPVQFLINFPVCVLIGLIDYFIIHTVYCKCKRLNKTYIRIAVDLLLTAVIVVLLAITANFIFSVVSPDLFSNEFSIVRLAIPLALWNSIIVLLIEVFIYSRQQIETEKKMAIIEKENIQHQYDRLKAQINPHFLFNSLNVLAALAYEDARKTNLFAKKMSGIYRYLLLTNTRPTVSLKEELAFVESYIFLEKVRFENALFIEIHNPLDVNKSIIPVSLQLLVENAIKHNITSTTQPLHIRIAITDDGITVSNNLQLRSPVDSNGTGLSNLQKQYALFDKTIEITKTERDFSVQVPFLT